MRNICLCLRPPVCGILLQQPQQTDTPTQGHLPGSVALNFLKDPWAQESKAGARWITPPREGLERTRPEEPQSDGKQRDQAPSPRDILSAREEGTCGIRDMPDPLFAGHVPPMAQGTLPLPAEFQGPWWPHSGPTGWHRGDTRAPPPHHNGFQCQPCRSGKDTAMCSGVVQMGTSREVPTGGRGERHGQQALHVAGMHRTARSGSRAAVWGRMPSPCLSFLIYKAGT